MAEPITGIYIPRKCGKCNSDLELFFDHDVNLAQYNMRICCKTCKIFSRLYHIKDSVFSSFIGQDYISYPQIQEAIAEFVNATRDQKQKEDT